MTRKAGLFLYTRCIWANFETEKAWEFVVANKRRGFLLVESSIELYEKPQERLSVLLEKWVGEDPKVDWRALAGCLMNDYGETK